MRDIIFRGRRIDNNEWVYGYFHFELEHTDNGAPEHYYREYDIQLPYITDGHANYLVDFNSVGQYTDITDVDGDNIYEGMTVHQKSVVFGSPDIDFVGKVKYYDGSCWIDNGKDAIPLFNENCENKIIKEY